MFKKIAIGVSDFKEVIEGDFYYVDKTNLVAQLFPIGSKVVLFPRPRRFGKTLALSMLKYFFDITQNNAHLFKNLAIEKNAACMAMQNQYPVIYLTFKDVKETTWENAYKSMIKILTETVQEHKNIILPCLDSDEKEDIIKLCNKSADNNLYQSSLVYLTKYLQRHYQKKVIVLLDEYDTPIHAAYSNGYYNEMINFLRGLMSAVFKDNVNLERGIITGILRIAKEGIFSDLNNIDVHGILNHTCAQYFGFTQQEVDTFLIDYNLQNQQKNVAAWYNGYRFGKITIYNPWSIINYVNRSDEGFKPYWINTSNNLIIKNLIAQADEDVKQQLELLITEQQIENISLNECITFPNIEKDNNALWSFLLFTGYLTTVESVIDPENAQHTLKIPNKEIIILYKDLIKQSINSVLIHKKVEILLHSLLHGDEAYAEYLLQEFIINSMSFYDLPANEPERSYHMFVLGMLVLLAGKYVVQSNRESGTGRYDIMLIPKNTADVGVIIEFKKMPPHRSQPLDEIADEALAQIKEKNYAADLKKVGVTNIIFYGIACEGKKVKIKKG